MSLSIAYNILGFPNLLLVAFSTHCPSTILPSALLPGPSASTVPASEGGIERQRGKVPSRSSDAGKVKKPTGGRADKLGRSPTVHYSPAGKFARRSLMSPGTKNKRMSPKKPSPKKKVKQTAVKAKAKQVPKPKDDPAKQQHKEGKKFQSPKLEQPDEATAKAVQASLNRATTIDLQQVVAPQFEGEGKEPDNDSDSYSDFGSESEQAEDNPEGISLEEVRRRKAIHARYMRFSRSLRSTYAEHIIQFARIQCDMFFSSLVFKTSCHTRACAVGFGLPSQELVGNPYMISMVSFEFLI